MAGVIKTLQFETGLLLSGTGGLLLSADVTSGTLTFSKIQSIASGTVLGAYTSGEITPLQLGSGLAIASGVIYNATPPSSGIMPPFVGCHVYSTTTQTPAASTWTPVMFDAEQFDTNAFHDPATNSGTRIAVPTGYAGKYNVQGMASWTTVGANDRGLRIRKNGSSTLATYMGPTATTSGVSMQTGVITALASGDYVELEVFQDSVTVMDVASIADYSPRFMCQYLGQ